MKVSRRTQVWRCVLCIAMRENWLTKHGTQVNMVAGALVSWFPYGQTVCGLCSGKPAYHEQSRITQGSANSCTDEQFRQG
jgi:hypothetical protein